MHFFVPHWTIRTKVDAVKQTNASATFLREPGATLTSCEQKLFSCFWCISTMLIAIQLYRQACAPHQIATTEADKDVCVLVAAKSEFFSSLGTYPGYFVKGGSLYRRAYPVKSSTNLSSCNKQ